MTDQELQALVNLTGLMPCDRLPKKDPDQELKNFLTRVAVNINGAVKSGAKSVRFSNVDEVAPVGRDMMMKAKGPLGRLGYDVEVVTSANYAESHINISGWSD